MQSEGLSPDVVTFTCLLKACGSTGSIDKGKEIHEDIIKRGLLRKDIVLGNAVVDMYAKCGILAKAREVLEELHGRDVATWNTLIAGYVRQGLCHEALSCYERMQSDGLSTNATTYVCILKACGSAGAVDKGIRIHEEISGSGLLERNMLLGNALVDMYAKCGKLDKAQRALEELPIRTVVAWSSLLAGYARQSDGYNALMCFEQMQNEGICPNDVTFSCVLNACGHAGRLDDACVLFNAMNQKYKIRPNVEHQTCMMKIFGCEGRLGKAVAVTKAMPPASPAVWLALLGACWKWGEVKLGKSAFDQVVQIDAQLMS
jgi:pentatricopeptide repeat protein